MSAPGCGRNWSRGSPASTTTKPAQRAKFHWFDSTLPRLTDQEVRGSAVGHWARQGIRNEDLAARPVRADLVDAHYALALCQAGKLKSFGTACCWPNKT